MIHNYLKSALRNLLRNKVFSFINIIGLAIGLAATIMIAMWVFDELSYDRFHANADEIYRVERDIHFEGQDFEVPVTGAIYGPTIRDNYPEVLSMARVEPDRMAMIDENNSRYNERVIFTDPSFFEIFSFPLIKGDPETALVEPNSLILTQDIAKKYFGEKEAMNQVIKMEFNNELVNFKVTGILAELPHNKHFEFEILGSFSTLEDAYGDKRMKSWASNYLYTYVLLEKGTNADDLSDKFDRIVEDHILPAYLAFFNSEEAGNKSLRILLRPITDIHLNAGLMWDIEPQGDMVTVYIFSIVAILILLIACFNFMNLSTALAGKRSLEIGIRKTVGSSNGQIVRQFLGESMLTTLLALILAFGLIEIFLPVFNNLTGKELSLSVFSAFKYLIILILLVLVTGLLAGFYPAFYMARVRPILVLKGKKMHSAGKFSFRQVLVILQYSISIALIIATIIANNQLKYISEKPLGFNNENMLVIPVESNQVRTHYEAFKNSLMKNPVIVNVSMSQKVPAEREYSDMGWSTDIQKEAFLSRHFAIDHDFIETYGIEMAAGRAFSDDYESDKTESRYIINETAAKKLGFQNYEEILGRDFGAPEEFEQYFGKNSMGKIIGVVKDFHFQSMRNKIEPLVLFLFPPERLSKITVRIKPGLEKEAVPCIEGLYKKHFPDVQYSYSFIENYLNGYYVGEKKLQTILISFTILAIVIACLGLFGLASFIAQQKVKEIGIRKSLGASVTSISILLSRSFSKWVLIANIIAWPVAYYFLSRWLDNFQYRIELGIWPFILAGLIALFVALLTISYKAVMAGKQNPVNSLRYE